MNIKNVSFIDCGIRSSSKYFRKYARAAFRRGGIDLDKHEIIFMDYTRGRSHFAKAMIKART